LIAGGLGFIGHHVSRCFLDAGWQVSILDAQTGYGLLSDDDAAARFQRRMRSLLGVEVVAEDIRTVGAVHALLEAIRPELVVHLANPPVAGLVSRDPIRHADAFTMGMLALLEASRVAGVRRFTYVSSSMVYGDFEHGIAREDSPTLPRELYGAMKLGCEHLLRACASLHGLDHTIVRPIAVYGPDGNPSFVLSRFLDATHRGGTMRVLGEDVSLDFTFVTDAARGIFLASTAPEGANQTFNIAGGGSRALLDAARHLQSRNPSATVEVCPADPLYPKRGTLDITKARTLLGFQPAVTLEAGLDLSLLHA
jgi:UDP-glucose 4-epimerase